MLGGVMREVAAAQRATLARRNVLETVRARPPVRRSAAARLRATLPRWRFVLPTLAVAGALALWVGRGQLGLFQARALSYAVGNETGAPANGHAGDVLEAGDRVIPLQFSDGSHVTLRAGARVQVAELDGRGATLRLERGAAEVDVHHRADTRWRVRAGGFEVTVTGTRFSIQWDESPATLTVVMAEGSVAVRGPGVDAASPVVVSAGQRFRASAHEAGWTLAAASTPPAVASISEPAADPTAVQPPAEAPGEIEAAPSARGGGSGPVGGAARATGWQALARAGRYPEALRAVERSGFARACRTLGAEDLIQLGDAARLARNPARAEAAYQAARQRFPASDRPAFALGLVAFEQRHDFKAAARWFQQYVQRYPSGPLAREAAGREMESWHRAGDSARAQRAAREYLEQAPAGPYAPLARQLATP